MKRPENAEVLAKLTPQEKEINELIMDAVFKLNQAGEKLKQLSLDIPKAALKPGSMMAILERNLDFVAKVRPLRNLGWIMPEMALIRTGHEADVKIGYDAEANEVFKAE